MKKLAIVLMVMVAIFAGTLPAYAADNKAPTKTGYTIYVNRATCKVDVYKNAKWYKGFSCSVGKASTPTPAGVFYTQAKGFSFGTSEYMCKYATQFKGNYCFHSYLYDSKGKYVIDGRMGMKISHGCIRLLPVNAQFICSLPRGTKIVIN
jgi:lipoprotein-anchoring transpeptidase ErfK/SrfK